MFHIIPQHRKSPKSSRSTQATAGGMDAIADSDDDVPLLAPVAPSLQDAQRTDCCIVLDELPNEVP